MIKKDRIILYKIIGYIDDIATYNQGMDYDSFLLDKKTISACAFTVSQIGELVKELTEGLQNKNTAIPWKSIRGMRNRIVHNYENIDLAVLWGTIEKSLPELRKQLIELLDGSP